LRSFVADLAEGVVQLRQRRGVIIFSARIRRDLNQRVLASGIASGAGFDGTMIML